MNVCLSAYQNSIYPMVISTNNVRRGLTVFAVGSGFESATLPDDSIGNTVVTFHGVNANSEIRVYLPNGDEVAGVELCDANHVLTWAAYASGSVNNTVRVVVVHPDYKIKEFIYTAAVGNASLPIQQELDRWYSNP